MPIGWHLVGASDQRGRHVEAKGLGGPQINDKFVFGRRLHGKVGRLLALEDAVDVAGRAPALFEVVRPVGDQAAGGDVKAFIVDGGQVVLGREVMIRLR